MEEGIISKSEPKVREVALDDDDDDDSDFVCYDRSEGQPVYVDVDKEMTESNKPILVLLPKKTGKRRNE